MYQHIRIADGFDLAQQLEDFHQEALAGGPSRRPLTRRGARYRTGPVC